MYSQIPKVFENWENLLKERQNIEIFLQLTEFQDKTSEKELIYNVTLSDLQYCIKSLFVEAAAAKLKKQIQANDQPNQNQQKFSSNLSKPGILIHEWDMCLDDQQQYIKIWDCDFFITGAQTSLNLKDFRFPRKQKQWKIMKSKQFIEKIYHNSQTEYQSVKHEAPNDNYQEESKIDQVLNRPDLIIKREGILKSTQVPNTSFSSLPSTTNKFQTCHQSPTYITIRELQVKQNFRMIGRVMDKSTDIEVVQNKKGDWDEFKIIVMDKNSDFIKVTFYQEASFQYFDSCNLQKTYQFSNGQVKEFSGGLQIIFKKWSYMKEIEEDFSIAYYPKLTQPMVIGSISKQVQNSEVNLIAVLHQIVQLGSTKTYVFVDPTGSIKAALFKNQLAFERKKNLALGSVVSIYKAIVTNIRNVTSLKISDTTLILPCKSNYQQKQELEKWYKQYASSIEIKNPTPIIKSNYCTIEDLLQLTAEAIGNNISEICITKVIRGALFSIQPRSYLYPSCPIDNKKMQFIENLKIYSCKKCLQTTQNPNFSFIFNASILDSTSKIDVTIFNELAVKLIGLQAKEFKDLLPAQQHRIIKGIFIKKGDFEVQMTIQESDIRMPNFHLLNLDIDLDYMEMAKQNFESIENELRNQSQREMQACF